MSDRRSFSEIPQETLRDHGAPARVADGWQRLAKDLAPATRQRRLAAPYMAVAAAAFASGVIVGGRFLSREPLPVPAMGAEPAEAPRPATPQVAPAPSASSRAEATPRAHQTAHRSTSHHADVAPRMDEIGRAHV